MVLDKSLPYTHVPIYLCSVWSNTYFHKIEVYHLTDLKNQSLSTKKKVDCLSANTVVLANAGQIALYLRNCLSHLSAELWVILCFL